MATYAEHDRPTGQVTEASLEDLQPATHGPGLAALQALLAKGPPEPGKVVELLDAHRSERDAMMRLLHEKLGNAYVQQVMQAMNRLRVDLDRKEVVAGDPTNPNGGSFLANQDGAQWRTADGRFTGNATKQGLHTEYQLDGNDALVGDVDLKGKHGTLGWEHDGETQGELYGDWRDRDHKELGLRRSFDLENGSTLTTGLRRQINRTPLEERPHLPGLSYGAPDGNRELELRDQRRNRESTPLDGAFVNYRSPDEQTTIDGALGMSNGDLAGSLGFSTQLGDNDKISAGYRRDGAGDMFDAMHLHTFDSGATLQTSAYLRNSAHGTSGRLSTAYRDSDTQLDASYLKGDGYSVLQFSGQQQLDKELSIYGGFRRTDETDGSTQSALNVGGRYSNGRYLSSVDVDAGTGERDYLGIRTSSALQLSPNMYAAGFAGTTAEAGQSLTSHLGASLTFTPSQKSALTLAGVLDQDGFLETRLQFDLFKSRVSNVEQLTNQQKSALVSVFVSYTQGDPTRRMLDDRFGRPESDFGLNNDGSVMAGIRIKF